MEAELGDDPLDAAVGDLPTTLAQFLSNDVARGVRVEKTMANDLMEREARRRAIDGFERPIIYQGEVTGEYTDFSDALLTTLMKGNKPEKYKERTQHSGSIGRPLTLDEETKEDVVSSILGMIKNKPDPKGK